MLVRTSILHLSLDTQSSDFWGLKKSGEMGCAILMADLHVEGKYLYSECKSSYKYLHMQLDYRTMTLQYNNSISMPVS
jgi:hypothetical protein